MATVQWIYRAFVEGGKAEREIAEILSVRGHTTDLGRPWTRGTVHQVLINGKYIGDNVWNRISFKLKKKRIRNSPDMWIRANRVFEPIVDRDLFEAAQAIIRDRSRRLSEDELLSGLRRLFEAQGCLSGLIIDETDHLPSSSVYRHRFGSLLRAYRLVGYSPRRDYRYVKINQALRRLHPEMIEEVVAGLRQAGSTVWSAKETDLLEVNGEFSLSVVIARCKETPTGALRWRLRFDTGLDPDVTIAVRMDASNRRPLDFYLFPSIDIAGGRVQLAEENGLNLDAYRFETLDVLYELAMPIRIREAA